MKYYLVLIALLTVGCESQPKTEATKTGTGNLERTVDKEFGVVCYSKHYYAGVYCLPIRQGAK